MYALRLGKGGHSGHKRNQSKQSKMSRHTTYRALTRTTARSSIRHRNRHCLRGRRHGPDDLSRALNAYDRALRAHDRLARLAPSFFDPAVVDREAENRAEVKRWMAAWEPAIARAYGTKPQPPATTPWVPPLPSPKIQRAVARWLAEWKLWLAAARAAMDLYQLRNPHALMSFTRMARLSEIAWKFRKLALGLDSPNELPDKLTYDYELTDVKRAYGHLIDPEPPPPPADVGAVVSGTN